VLTATSCFPSVFFQLKQYSRKHSSFSAHKAALMAKTEQGNETKAINNLVITDIFAFQMFILSWVSSGRQPSLTYNSD